VRRHVWGKTNPWQKTFDFLDPLKKSSFLKFSLIVASDSLKKFYVKPEDCFVCARQACVCWSSWWCIWCGSRSWTHWSSLSSTEEPPAALLSISASSTVHLSSWLRWPSSSACWPASSLSFWVKVFRGWSWTEQTKPQNVQQVNFDYKCFTRFLVDLKVWEG